MKDILLIGFGAMGRTVLRELEAEARARVCCILETANHVAVLRKELGATIEIISSLDELPRLPDLALECASHEAVSTLVPVLLQKGVRTIIASVGALSEQGLPERLERAALEGGGQLILVPGAVAGMDALSAARQRTLHTVTYVGCKPPRGWLGTPAEDRVDLASLTEATIVFEGNARDAARLYPKNANVAAMVALAGLGMESTRVSLVADPDVTRNTHTVYACGDFGDLEIRVSAHPLPDNPKTSALAALSIVRAVRNQVDAVVI